MSNVLALAEANIIVVAVVAAVVALLSFINSESEQGLRLGRIEPYQLYRRTVWPIMVAIMLIGEWIAPIGSRVIALAWFAVFEGIALVWRNEATLSAFLRHLVRRKSNWPMIAGAAIYIVVVLVSAVMPMGDITALKYARFSILATGLSAWIIWHIYDDPDGNT